MIRRPPISTRTYTLFPYTTLFRAKQPLCPRTRCACLIRIDRTSLQGGVAGFKSAPAIMSGLARFDQRQTSAHRDERAGPAEHDPRSDQAEAIADGDRKSTRLNSSH